MRIYLAGPLFSVAERTFNEGLAAALERQGEDIHVLLPQKHASELTGAHDFPRRMFEWALGAIDDCDAVIAVLEGTDADSGTCIEMGYARARNKVIIGLRTDLRPSEDRGLNLMVANVCSTLILQPAPTASLGSLVDDILDALAR